MNTSRIFMVAVGLSFLLTGCLSNVSDEHKTQGGGLVSGVIAGAVVGNLTGGDTKSTIIGGVVGGILGLGIGNEVAKRKEKYASAEEAIESEVALANQFIKKTTAYNQQLHQDITAYKTQIAQLENKRHQNRLSSEELKRQKALLDKRHEEAKQVLEGTEKELSVTNELYDDYKTQADASELSEWQRTIARLEQEKSVLKGQIDQLYAMSSNL